MWLVFAMVRVAVDYVVVGRLMIVDVVFLRLEMIDTERMEEVANRRRVPKTSYAFDDERLVLVDGMMMWKVDVEGVASQTVPLPADHQNCQLSTPPMNSGLDC